MASKPHKTKKELQRESMELALTERRCFLRVTMVLSLSTALSSVLGAHWTLPAGTGIGAALSALSGYLRR